MAMKKLYREFVDKLNDRENPFPESILKSDMMVAVHDGMEESFEKFEDVRDILFNRFKNLKNIRLEFGDCEVQELGKDIYMVMGCFTVKGFSYQTEVEKRIFLTLLVHDSKITSFSIIIPSTDKRVYEVKSGSRLDIINEEDLLYLEKKNCRNSTVWHYGDKTITENASLKSCRERLSDKFVMARKGLVVNLSHIRSIDGNIIHMSNDDELECTRYVELRKMLSAYRGEESPAG